MINKYYESFEGFRIEVEIPKGFHILKGNVDKGLVIENETGDSFVRIPSGYTADGTYIRGFWVSTYLISKGKDGQARSVSGEYPWTDINFYRATEVAHNFGGELLTREEYNRICMWLVKTCVATFDQVFIDGEGRGNYSEPHELEKTGAHPEWLANNIDSFWGNAYIWTTERSQLYEHYRMIRGGISSIYGTESYYPPSSSAWSKPEEGNSNISFRIVLHDAIREDED